MIGYRSTSGTLITLRNKFWWNFCLAVYFHCFWIISRRWFQKCDYFCSITGRWLSVRLFMFVGSTPCQPGKMNYAICNSKSLERATKNHNDCNFCTILHCKVPQGQRKKSANISTYTFIDCTRSSQSNFTSSKPTSKHK